MRSCRWTRRARRARSTSAAGRSSRSRPRFRRAPRGGGAARPGGAGRAEPRGPPRRMIDICDYGRATRRSVVKAFERVAADVRMTDDLSVLEQASALVVPGVGAFPQAMDEL